MSKALKPKISYAQNGEDVRAWRALRDVPDPFYVEVGASHPFDDSLTAALYELGWRGLLVEADPLMAEELRKTRPGDVVVAAAAHSTSGLLTFSPPEARGQGTVEPAHDDPARPGMSVPAVRLADVLADLDPPDIHFASVDVEGHERDALLGLDLKRWRPWVLCIEATAPDSRRLVHEQWEDVVIGAGYQFVAFDGLNRWYVEPAHAELRDRVAEPFGVLDGMLDGWVRRERIEFQDDVERTRSEIDRLVAEREQLVAAGDHQQRRLEQAEADADEQAGRAGELQARLQQLSHQLEAVTVGRAAAEVRERVMLESKSWRMTAPLRSARWRAGTTAGRWLREGDRPRPPAAVRLVATPVLERRLLALQARAAAAVRRAEAAG